MRLIDEDNLVPDICDAEIEYGTKPVHFSANAIDLAQTVDAVPVVRCLECKYRKYDDIFGMIWCNLDSCTKRVKPYDFCSHGERKEGVD